jgi:DNA-binding GntR family transcriptional regulator
MMRETIRGPAPSEEPVLENGVISHASLPEAVYLLLRRRILNNEFIAGERLVEAKLAEELGVSRTTIRSALRELDNESLVEITKRRGCFVTRMTPQEIQDSCFARYLLEAGVASEDLHWITPAVLAELEEQIENMKVAALNADMASIVDADTAFHGIIMSAGGRSRVTALWHMLDGQMGSLMRSSMDQQGIDMSEIVLRHREVIAALETRKGSVIQQAIKEHYVRAPSVLGAVEA